MQQSRPSKQLYIKTGDEIMKSISKRIRPLFIFVIVFFNITGFTCSASFTDWFSPGQEISKNVRSDSGWHGPWEILYLFGCEPPQ